MMEKVNLFLVGAMKCGSSTLHEYLDLHPDITMSLEKEPGYFVPELWGKRKPEEYAQLFPADSESVYFGESSTHYTKIPRFTGVPEKMHAYNPAAKLIYIVRNPYERTVSHYYHSVRNLAGYGETRTVFDAVKSDPVYTAYSDYALQIEPYINLFGRDQIKVVRFEDMLADRTQVVNDVFRWLGLEDIGVIEQDIKANITPAVYRKAKGRGLLNTLRHSKAWEMVSPLVPTTIKNMGNQLAEETSHSKITEDEKRQLFEYLNPSFEEAISRLENLLERDFSLWRKSLK